MRLRSVLLPVIFVTAAVAPVISIPAPTAPPVPPDGSIRAHQKELAKRQLGLPTPSLKLASASATATTSYVKPSAFVYFQGLEDMSGMGIAADKFFQDFKNKDETSVSVPTPTPGGFSGNWRDKLNWSTHPPNKEDTSSVSDDDETSISDSDSAPASPAGSSHNSGSLSEVSSDPSSSNWHSSWKDKGKQKSNLKRGSESD